LADRSDYFRRLRYGIEPEEYQRLMALQRGVCAICHEANTPNGEIPRMLAVDHDHVTGEVRGLLCHGCNYLVGTVESDRGKRALRYLRPNTTPGVPPSSSNMDKPTC
jgi:hypothetical protein